MVKRKVVLVTGAGASMSHGYPSGATLKALIADGLMADPAMCDAIIRTAGEGKGWSSKQWLVDFGQRLKGSPMPSIDAFLQVESNSVFLRAGKAAIVYQIAAVEAQKHCCLTDENDDWLGYLFARLLSDVTRPSQLAENGVSIVTFNFDRVVEARWCNALRNHFGIEGDELDEAFGTLEVIHVHGAIAPDLSPAGLISQPIAQAVAARDLSSAVHTIKLVHDDVPPVTEALTLIEDADVVCFLGLSYAVLNLQRIGYPQRSEYTAPMWGTAWEVDDGELVAAYIALTGKGPTKHPLPQETLMQHTKCLSLLKRTTALHFG